MRKRSNLLFTVMVFIVAIVCMSLCAYAEGNKQLSEMTDEECIKFLESNGTEIPEEYIDYKELGATVKEMIIYIEEHPKVEHIYNYTAKDELFTNVRETVLKYYDIKPECESFLSTYSSNSVATLKYSKAMGSWNKNCESRNCYGFAINVTGRLNPGYMIGAVYDANSISTISIERFANLAASDLSALGYTNVTYGSTRPSYQSGYKVIAVRKATDDFHFMAEVSSNIWRHKPGDSVELQYNYSSPASGKWTNEGIGKYGLQGGNREYTSNIMYIKYKLK